MAHLIPAFRLTFDLAEVPYWSNRCDYTDDKAVIAVGESARDRGRDMSLAELRDQDRLRRTSCSSAPTVIGPPIGASRGLPCRTCVRLGWGWCLRVKTIDGRGLRVVD